MKGCVSLRPFLASTGSSLKLSATRLSHGCPTSSRDAYRGGDGGGGVCWPKVACWVLIWLVRPLHSGLPDKPAPRCSIKEVQAEHASKAAQKATASRKKTAAIQRIAEIEDQQQREDIQQEKTANHPPLRVASTISTAELNAGHGTQSKPIPKIDFTQMTTRGSGNGNHQRGYPTGAIGKPSL